MSDSTNKPADQRGARTQRLAWNPILPLIHLAVIFPVCAIRGFTVINTIGLATLALWLLLATINYATKGGIVRKIHRR